MSDQPDATESEPTESVARPWARPVLVGSAVVILACLVSLAVLWVVVDRADQGADDAERDAVMAVTADFVVRINTFGPDDLNDQDQMPEYTSRVGEVMTAKFRTEFEEAQTLPEQLVKQAQVGRTATVNAVGVSTLGESSATVVTAFEMVNSYPAPDDENQRVEDRAIPMRWTVTLRKIEGEWLVDGYDLVPDRLEEDSLPLPDDQGDGQDDEGQGDDGNGGGER